MVEADEDTDNTTIHGNTEGEPDIDLESGSNNVQETVQDKEWQVQGGK